MESYRLASDADMERLLIDLDSIKLDGSYVATLGVKKEKRSTRQLKYLWLLIRTIASSGRGSHDTAEGVEAEIKWRFLRPILISADTMYAEVMHSVEKLHAADPAMMQFVTSKLFHFSDLNTTEMAQALTDIIGYFGQHIDLPMPENGLLGE